LKYRLAALLLALLAGSAVAGSIQGTCDVLFLATSTLHDFSGTARSRPFTAPLAADGAGKAVLPALVLEFPVADMRTGNDSRDGKMREMFQADRHPVIRAVARDVDAESLRERMRKDRNGKVPLPVFLDIRGMERKIQATAGNWKETGEQFSFDVEFPVSLREFGLAPPSVLGIIRVADRVDVKGNVTGTVRGSP
jgi:hypothetical protein